ncbi:DgyrCDS12979 [Dimorphilus gyrociliatus]|uniref:Oxysterol-binding protein n=1 Tax=Dimorphilus gyrociliatus TaxID=2664684 RepID=A0A7I8W9A9_9ANNE|nr:DgyrCDS12979 [Dimorphilus gyrociliatus]
MSTQEKKSIDSDEDEFYECEASPKKGNHSRQHSRNSSLPKAGYNSHRTRLPVKMFSRSEFSVWSILKQCIGKELSKITMPIVFNEPLSFLQRITEYMEYSDLLTKANESPDPTSRMEYVAAFAVSALSSNHERLAKPFNPLLGETYELVRPGVRLTAEQVSHHPPVSAFHAESENYSFCGSIHPKMKFWGKSVEITPKGNVILHLKKWNETYTWSNVVCSIHNIIIGKMWIEHYGKMDIKCIQTGWETILNFHSCGWRSHRQHEVDGYVLSEDKEKMKYFIGRWIDNLYSYDVTANMDNIKYEDALQNQLPNQRLLWSANKRSDQSHEYYNFSNFAITLNEMGEGFKSLPPTDSRLRPDIRKLEEGDVDGAGEEKHRVEEKQRESRRHRKKDKNDWCQRKIRGER